tara:strand:- start:2331 stop:5780 length:3450 start_codon:yes stop_codon:yes gene_type:complete
MKLPAALSGKNGKCPKCQKDVLVVGEQNVVSSIQQTTQSMPTQPQVPPQQEVQQLPPPPASVQQQYQQEKQKSSTSESTPKQEKMPKSKRRRNSYIFSTLFVIAAFSAIGPFVYDLVVEQRKIDELLAKNDFKAVLQLEPENREALAMKRQSDIKDALASGEFSVALELAPDNPEALAMKKEFEIKKALEEGDYKRVLSLDPKNEKALEEKRLFDALESGDYQLALQIAPNNPRALELKQHADLQQALANEDHEAILRLDPTNVRGLHLKRLSAALKDRNYQLALELDPTNTSALEMKERAEKLAVALESGDYQSVLLIDPENVAALAMKQNEEVVKPILAKGDYETALKIDPTNIAALELKTLASNTQLEALALLFNRNTDVRSTKIREYGGTQESEAAVAMGLKWIANQQATDGSWEFDGTLEGRRAATAMALIAFLGSGNTHKKGNFKTQFGAGLSFLIQSLGGDGSLRDSKLGMFSHGLATTVLSECAVMTQDPILSEPLTAAINFINSAHRADEGGWGKDEGDPVDDRITIWQISALKYSGTSFRPQDRRTLANCKKRLLAFPPEELINDLNGDDDSKRLIAVIRLHGLMLLSDREHKEYLKCIDAILELGPSDNDIYYNYYAGQLVFQHKAFLSNENATESLLWDSWNKSVLKKLISAQKTGTGTDSGSFSFNYPNSLGGGRLMDTSFALMILQIYYRYSQQNDLDRIKEQLIAKRLDEKINAVGPGKPTVERGAGGEIIGLTFRGVRGEDSLFKETEFLADLTSLQTLSFHFGQIDGAMFKHIQSLPNLFYIRTSNTTISGPVLTHFKDLKKLEALSLTGPTDITDEELEIVGGLGQLKILGLNSAEITDEGLAHLKSLDSLSHLHLANTKINGSALVHLATCPIKQLTLETNPNLNFENARWLTDLKSLSEITLRGAPVTREVINRLTYARAVKQLNVTGQAEFLRILRDRSISDQDEQLQIRFLLEKNLKSVLPLIRTVHWAPAPNPIDVAFHKFNNWNSRPVFINQLDVEVLRDFGEKLTLSEDRKMAVYSSDDRSNIRNRKALNISFFWLNKSLNPTENSDLDRRVDSIKQQYLYIDLGSQGLKELTDSVLDEFNRLGEATRAGNRVTWNYPEFKRAVIFEFFPDREIGVELTITRTR